MDLVPAPVIREVGIFPPGGGKVPLQGEFCADVEFAVPELAEEAVLRWDLDGNGVPDVESGTEDCPTFTYQSCEPANVLVTVTAVDRFGRSGPPIERSLKLSCNQVPSVSCAVVKLVAQPRPGDNLQFFVTGFDPDANDPGSDRGVVRFEVDFEGDGIFDQTLPGNRQELPINHSYSLAGQFRPTIRAYDTDGEYGVTTCDVVSVLEEFLPGDLLDLRFSPVDVQPATGLGPSAVSSAAFALFGDRIGALAVTDGSWLLDDVAATPGDLVSLDRVGNVLIGAGADLHTALAGSGAAVTSLTPWSSCGFSIPSVTQAHVGGSATAPVLVVSGAAGIHLFDAASALTASVASSCSALLQQLANPVSTPAVAGMATTWATEQAVALDDVLYAAVTTRDTAGSWGVVAYDISATPPTVWCGSGGSGCLVTSSRVRTLAGRPQERMAFSLTRPAFWDVGAGPLRYTLPRRARMAATATARIWVDGQQLLPATDTFWFPDDAHVTLDRGFASSATFAASTTAQLAYDTYAQIAVATEDGNVHLYDLDVTAGGVSWTFRDNVSAPVPTDRLVYGGQYLFLTNNSGAYDTTGTTYEARQSRGVWAWPLDRRSGWLRVLPRRRSVRDNPDWSGPQSVVPDKDQIWIADGSAGLRLLQTGRLLAATTPVSTVAVAVGDDVGIGGAIARFVAVPSEPRLLAATFGGVAQIRVERRNDSRPRPILEWLTPATEAIQGVSFLRTEDGRDVVAAATTQAVVLFERNQPRTPLAWLPAVSPGAIRYVELLADPDASQPYVLYTFEAAGQGSVVLQGLDDQPLRPNGRRTRFMQDLGGDVQSQSLGTVPPVVSRLTPAPGASRTFALFFQGFDRLCIEAFWGGNCPVDHLGKTVVLMPSTVGGSPWPLSVRGRRMIVRTNAVSGAITVLDRDGLVVRSDIAPCTSVEEILQFACVSGNATLSAANADPFWLHATEFGIFIFDFSDPIVPRLVTSDFASGKKIRGMVGVKDGTDLLVGYHCDGSGSSCSSDGNAVLRTFLVKGVVSP